MRNARSKRGSGPTKNIADGNTRGSRQWGYMPEYALKAEEMCKLGATTAELADAFGVSMSTINGWRIAHKDFSEACKHGGSARDDRIERSLYESAHGYDYVAEKVVMSGGQPKIVKYLKHVPANHVAAKFWLANRKPGKWSINPEPADDENNGTPLSRMFDAICGHQFMPVEHVPKSLPIEPELPDAAPIDDEGEAT